VAVSIDAALTRFFTARTPARPIALCRMGIGLAALGKGLAVVFVLFQLAHDPRAVQAPAFAWSPRFDTAWEILPYGLVWAGAAAGLALGWHARACSAVLFGCAVLAHVLEQNLWSNHIYLLTLLLLLLCVAQSDAALSLRSRRAGGAERDIVRWPVLLMKLQLSIVYFYTAAAKMNPAFLGGHVIEQVVRIPPALHRPGVLATLAVATVAIELFLSFALWVRALRPWGFLLGLLLHGSIAVLMGPSLWIFSLMTLSLYAVFLEVPRPARLVIWDDGCTFCRGWIRLARRLDLLRAHRFEGATNAAALGEAGVTSEEAGEEIKLWDGTRVHGGFDAIRVLLERTPLGFLWARALALPVVRPLGVRAYRAIARRRRCGLTPAAPV